MGIFYLYRHIRVDTNEVFYIGIGKKEERNFRSLKSEYRRAFTKNKRSKIWKNIISKTDFKVEIVMDNCSESFVKNKEIEFIKLYGRRDLNLGTLVNFTDGGDGSRNVVVSKETKCKMSKAFNREIREDFYNNLKKRCISIEDGIVYSSLKEACIANNLNYGAQKMAIKHKRITAKFMYEGEEFEPIIKKHNKAKTCKHIKSGKIFSSLKEGCEFFNLKYSQQTDANSKNLKTKQFIYI